MELRLSRAGLPTTTTGLSLTHAHLAMTTLTAPLLEELALAVVPAYPQELAPLTLPKPCESLL